MRALEIIPKACDVLIGQTHAFCFNEAGEIALKDVPLMVVEQLDGTVTRMTPDARGVFCDSLLASKHFWRTDHSYDEDLLLLVSRRRILPDASPYMIHDVFLYRLKRAHSLKHLDSAHANIVNAAMNAMNKIEWTDNVLEDMWAMYSNQFM